MPVTAPICASSRDPKRPRPIPRAVRSAVLLMIHGDVDDPDGRPLDFVEAGKRCGVKIDVMRRWLDKPEVRSFLRSERRLYREAACAGNESAMVRVRDKSENGMAICAAVRVLESIAEVDGPRARENVTPGVTIIIHPAPPSPVTIEGHHRPITIDHTAEPEEVVDPTVFRHPRDCR